MHHLRVWAEYLPTICLLRLLALVPWRWHDPVADALGAFLYHALPFRRGLAESNIQQALGPQAPAELRRKVRAFYGHVVRLGLEVAYARYRATVQDLLDSIPQPIDGQEHLDRVKAAGTGWVIACGHIGNWDWVGYWHVHAVSRVCVVVKPMHNPLIERWIARTREKFGLRIARTTDRTPRELLRIVREGGAVGILADQDAGRRGEFFPLFGKPASTPTGLATIAIRLNVPILPGFLIREGPRRFRCVCLEPIWPDPEAPREAEERRIMTAYNQAIETIIRRAPEQYFWWHQRWKTRPKVVWTRGGDPADPD